MNRGAYEWLWMRVLGVLMLPIGLWLVYFILHIEPMNAQTLVHTVLQPVYGCALVVSALIFGLHSYLGMREIIIDYVHHPLFYVVCRSLLQIGLIVIVCGLSGFLIRGMCE